MRPSNLNSQVGLRGLQGRQDPDRGAGAVSRNQQTWRNTSSPAPSAVEVGTAHFIDPRASVELVDGLKMWCRAENTFDINELRGALQR